MRPKNSAFITHNSAKPQALELWGFIWLSRKPAEFLEFATEVAYQAHTKVWTTSFRAETFYSTPTGIFARISISLFEQKNIFVSLCEKKLTASIASKTLAPLLKQLDPGTLGLSLNKTGLHPTPLITPLKWLIKRTLKCGLRAFVPKLIIPHLREYSQEFLFHCSNKKIIIFVPQCLHE